MPWKVVENHQTYNVWWVVSIFHVDFHHPLLVGSPSQKNSPEHWDASAWRPVPLYFECIVTVYLCCIMYNVYKYVLMIFDVCAFIRDFCICCVCRIVTYLDLWWLLVSNKDIHVIYLTHPQPTWMSPTSEVEIQSEPLWWPNFRSESLPRGRVKEGSTKNSRGSTQ